MRKLYDGQLYSFSYSIVHEQNFSIHYAELEFKQYIVNIALAANTELNAVIYFFVKYITDASYDTEIEFIKGFQRSILKGIKWKYLDFIISERCQKG